MARKLNRVYADHLLFTNQVVTYLLTPREDLSAVEGTQEIEDVVKQLRRDSRARPIEVGQTSTVSQICGTLHLIRGPGTDGIWSVDGHLSGESISRGSGVSGTNSALRRIFSLKRSFPSNSISIPGGDYRKVRDDLYVKLNLRKFGCGGRSSLTIDPPTLVCAMYQSIH
jgi:hypothetical protein